MTHPNRQEAIRLRKEGSSYSEITEKTGIAGNTLSYMLRNITLTDEQRSRLDRKSKEGFKRFLDSGDRSTGYARSKNVRQSAKENPSKLARLIGGRILSRSDKGRIAEAAILLRLTAIGLPAYKAPFDGDEVDWLVRTGSRTVVIQVKYASGEGKRSPKIRLRKSNGRGKYRRYEQEEVDFFVGYDLYSDTACVWTWEEVKGKHNVSFSDDAVERWDKIKSAS
jgi:hypothetical protein